MFAKTFRNTLIASTLVVSGAALATPAMADTVQLNGSVASTSAVTSTRTSGAGLADALNLRGAGTAQADVVVKVADMALISNNTGGVTLTAAGDAGLTNGTSVLPYKVLIVADAAAAPAATAFSAVSDSQAVTNFVSGAAARDLYIEYDAPALLDPGAYTGAITVSVVDL